MFANCCRGGPGVRRRCAASGYRANMPQSGEAQQLFADLKRLLNRKAPAAPHKDKLIRKGPSGADPRNTWRSPAGLFRSETSHGSSGFENGGIMAGCR